MNRYWYIVQKIIRRVCYEFESKCSISLAQSGQRAKAKYVGRSICCFRKKPMQLYHN